MLHNHIKEYKTFLTKYFNNINSLQYRAIVGRIWGPILLIVANVIAITYSLHGAESFLRSQLVCS